MVQDKASVSFGATPLLLQLATGHYRNISIHTAGNRIGDARGMKADVQIDDVRLDGDADAMGTVGGLDAMITWSADGMKQSIQDAITPLRGLVTGVQTNPDDGTIKLQRNLGSVTTKPQVTDGRVALQVVDVTGLGLLLPSEMVQSALDAFTTHLTENYPLDIHADSVQITDDAVTAHYSTRDTSIPRGQPGQPREQGQPGPLLRRPIGQPSMARRGEGCERLRDRKDYEITEVARRSSRCAPNSRHDRPSRHTYRLTYCSAPRISHGRPRHQGQRERHVQQQRKQPR